MGKGHVQTDYQLKSNSYTFYTGLTLDVLAFIFRARGAGNWNRPDLWDYAKR